MAEVGATTVGTERVTTCDMCGSTDYDLLLPNVRDRLHDLPGCFSLIRCSNCTLVRLSPRPDGASLPSYYPAEHYTAYQPADWSVAFPGRPFAAVRELLRSAVLRARGYENVRLPGWTRIVPKHLPRWLVHRAAYGLNGFPEWVAGGRALDLGCGNGLFLNGIRLHGWDVVGVDLSAAAAMTARASFGIEVHVGELDDAPIDERSFDFVHMSHVIEHLPHPVQTLHRIASLLRPGGRLYVETPNIDSLGFRLSQAYWYPLDAPRHLWLFSPDTLRGALEQCGFSVSRLDAWSRPTFDWEATYKREERDGCLGPRPHFRSERLFMELAALKSLDRSERPRAAALTLASRAASRLSPRLGDIMSCWAELPPNRSSVRGMS
jgi:2-polyprenyl-3-methyl-5-hydroxy-6-metoxy-1,4-benzoquinol methylase